MEILEIVKFPGIGKKCAEKFDCPLFYQKGVGDPNPSTVRQMPFFRGTISKKIVF